MEGVQTGRAKTNAAQINKSFMSSFKESRAKKVRNTGYSENNVGNKASGFISEACTIIKPAAVHILTDNTILFSQFFSSLDSKRSGLIKCDVTIGEFCKV